MTRALEIRIDPERCRGVGQCVLRAPATFGLDDDGKGAVLGTQNEPLDVIVAASRSCPNFAVSVRDGDRELA